MMRSLALLTVCLAWGLHGADHLLRAQSAPEKESLREHSLREHSADSMLHWESLPNLPDALGVAGPFVGVHGNRLIVAGGANFEHPIWETTKQWRDQIWVLVKTPNGLTWRDGGRLMHPVAYGMAVSTPAGVVCLGGNDSVNTFDRVFLLHWNASENRIEQIEYPRLPRPCAYGQATLVGDVIYVAGGQSESGLESAMNNFWSLDLSQQTAAVDFQWQELVPWSDVPRALNMLAHQHSDLEDCLYVVGGRRQSAEGVEFLHDVWEFRPSSGQWRRRQDLPRGLAAVVGIGFGQSHLLVLGGDDGALFDKTEELRDAHPGFRREALAYHTHSDTWTSLGATPANQLTTVPVLWDGRIIIASGEVRPRVRTPAVWSIVCRLPRRY
jgi:SSS family solute:Na+ symporter